MGIGSMVAARAYLSLLGRREVLHRVGAREGDGKDLYLQDDVALHVGRGLVPQLAQLARHLLQRLVESGVRVGVRVRLRVRVRVRVRVRARARTRARAKVRVRFRARFGHRADRLHLLPLLRVVPG